MNIQFAEEYKMWRRGKRSVGFWAVGAGAREKKDAGRNMSMKRRRD